MKSPATYLAIFLISMALFILGSALGVRAATFSIANGCVHDNEFDHDGYKFTCYDQDDYFAP